MSDAKFYAALRDGKVKMDEMTAASIADIAQFMGLKSSSSVEQLSYLVSSSSVECRVRLY